MPAWRRSFALRTALLAAAAMLAVSLLGSAWGWLNAERALRQQLDIILAAEAQELLREYETFGLAGLATAVETYSRRRGPLLVLLQSGDGRIVAGRLQDVPLALQGFTTLPESGGNPARRALGAILPGGFELVVATDLAPVQQAATALDWTSPLAALAAALVALVAGFIAARGLERRLAGVSAAARAVVAGELSRRLPESGRGDEFDRLVGTINAMLARIDALVAAQRQVTDDIAHDLRSPLSRLRQGLEAALARPREPDADAATLEAAAAELDQVLAAFSGLLRIARAESGAGWAAFEDVDLSALVTGMAELYAP
ncbi:MAG: HAMP domain-containing protein, partial [Solirubrobacteraceae bacterium]